MEIPQNCLAKKIKEQLFFWQGENLKNLVDRLETSESFLAANEGPDLSELAYSLYSETPKNKSASYNLAIVAESINDLKTKIVSAKELLGNNTKFIPARYSLGGRDAKGIYFSSSPLAKSGKIAFLFSGQGSQRLNMLKDLTPIFREMRESIHKADTVLKDRLPKLLSEYIYPPAVSMPEQEKVYLEELTQTNITQPALGAVEVGLYKIVKLFGINADMVAGHSLGEYVALYAAGVLEEKTLYELLEYRGSAIMSSGKSGNLGKMLAVGANIDDIKDIVKDINEVYFANLNSPKQTILSGDEKGLESAGAKLKEKGFKSVKINVSCAFHSPYMSEAKKLLFGKLATLDYKMPAIPVYSNLSALQYPNDRDSILSILSEHLISSVKFTEEVENMFKDGARVFIEIGPGNILTNLVKQILGEKDYVVVASNTKTSTDAAQLLNVFAQLIAEGFEVDLSPMFD